MKGRLTVEIDFDNNNDIYLQALLPVEQEDTRDKMLRNFFDKLGYTSSWLHVTFSDQHREGESRLIINAVKPEDLAYHAKVMTDQVQLMAKNKEQQSITY